MAKHTRIVLADDHFAIRIGIRAILENEPDFTVVGEAEDGLAAIQCVESARPNVLVCDIGMPNLTGDEVVRRVHHKYPSIKIVVLSMYKEDRYVANILQGGGSAYLLKSATEAELVDAVRSVLGGKTYLGAPFRDKGTDYFNRFDLSNQLGALSQLTKREREVLQQVVEGRTSAEIGLELSIAPRTVETHRANIMRKLDIHSLPDLIRFAIQHGIVTLE